MLESDFLSAKAEKRREGGLFDDFWPFKRFQQSNAALRLTDLHLREQKGCLPSGLGSSGGLICKKTSSTISTEPKKILPCHQQSGAGLSEIMSAGGREKLPLRKEY
jgi:hypothetical protein